MVKLEDAVIAKLEHSGETFEILVDPYLANDLKKGNKVDFSSLLAAEDIFKDAKSGELQAQEAIKKSFPNMSFNQIVEKIIEKGRVQLTTQQKHEMQEAKRKEIIHLISRNTYNPQTKTPHPPQRIETAMQEAKVQIDVFKSAEEQLPEIIQKLKPLIPISIETLEVAVKIPPLYAPRAFSFFHNFKIKKQEWTNTGHLILLFEIPAGLKTELIGLVNKFTNSEADIKFLD